MITSTTSFAAWVTLGRHLPPRVNLSCFGCKFLDVGLSQVFLGGQGGFRRLPSPQYIESMPETFPETVSNDVCQDVNVAEMPHFFVAPAFDINVGNSVRQLGTFDLGQSYALQTLCRTGDAVIDVGTRLSTLKRCAPKYTPSE